MAKLDLDADNVEHVNITLEQARDGDFDLNNFEGLVTALDNAQAHVFGGDHSIAYVIIAICK